ncbi:MAG: folate family ECF transporter S component, partial [Halanaerobiaceae bacterium]|nr:folate family ECF transporter S component [Halanaerobiaceae bacterium]
MKTSSYRLVFMSFLIALSIILTRILSIRVPIGGVEGIRIGFGGLPIIFAGVIGGPVAGGVVGAMSDMLGYFINPIGPYMPHFTLTSFLTGYIPGLIIKYVFRKKAGFYSLFTAIAIGQITTSVILVPLFVNMLFKTPLEVLLIPRVISQAVHIPLYTVFI